MSYDLRVVFHGMCLWVRTTDEVHVLMPATGGAGGCAAGGVEAHAAVLVFDTAHLRSDSTTLDNLVALQSIERKKITFPGGTGTLNRALPPELAQLGSPVRADVLSGEASTLLNSRVLLQGGGWSDHSKGACWSWGGQIRRLSHVVEWTVAGVEGDSLEIQLEGLAGGVVTMLPPLHPVGGVVEVEVWHAPHPELPPASVIPPEPDPGSPGHHFSAYGKLLQSGFADMPAYVPDACPEIENPGRWDEDGGKGSATYGCMSAEALPPG